MKMDSHSKEYRKKYYQEHRDKIRKYQGEYSRKRTMYKKYWNELKKLLMQELAEGRSEDNLWLMGCYDQAEEILEMMQELEGKNERY